MKIKFTLHALSRIKNRNILNEEVIEAIKYPDRIIKMHNKYFMRKKYERGTIEVCCTKKENIIKIITVYWI